MPKLNVNTVEVTQEAIEKELVEIGRLLQGRLADDNILLDGDYNKVLLSAKNINGYPDVSRPISNSVKVVGGSDFNINVWWKLYLKFLKNTEFTIVQATNAWALDEKRSSFSDMSSVGLYQETQVDEHRHTMGFKNNLTNMYSKRYFFPRTLSMRPVTLLDLQNYDFPQDTKDMLGGFPNQDKYVVSPNLRADSNITEKDFYFSVSDAKKTIDGVYLDVDVHIDKDLGDEDYFAQSLSFEMLFEVVK